MLITQSDKLRIERLTLGPYETNTYILICKKTRESLVIDAPADEETIIKNLNNTKAKYILLTHDHYDHTGALTALRTKTKALLATHEYSSYQLDTPPQKLLDDGDAITLGALKIRVIFTPGHTPGGLCFLTDKYLFAGDTIFPGGPGHTETPEDFKQIILSITQKIYVHPDDTEILPGHGASTTVKKSKEDYAVFASKPHDELYGDVTWASG
jgi:hydroxyacylglutathione hydrolase